MSTTTSEIPLEVLEVLGLPPLEDVTAGQARGADCVWCGTGPLAAATALDLGQQKTAEGLAWFPRACRGCTADRAHEGLFAHTPKCEKCRKRAGSCKVGLILYRLVRDGSR